MVHNQLHAIDLIIIAAYLISMVLIGVVVVKKVQSMDDYYLGGRSFGPLVLMATVCATIIGGSGLMGRAGVAYSSGFKAIMTALPYLLGMFIFSGFAGRISAVGTTFHVTSIPDLFEQRFGKTTKVILGGLIAFTMMGTVASQVTATATIINMLGNEIGISYEMGALIACVVFIVYTATSGLFGVIYTDVFQFVMLILFVYILIPSASLVKLGGLSAFLEGLAPELAKPYLDGGIVGDIITYFVFTLAGVCVSIDHHDDLYVSLQYCGWLFHRTVRGQHGAFRRQYRLSCRQHSSCRRHHVRYRRQRRRRCKDRAGKTGGSQP